MALVSRSDSDPHMLLALSLVLARIKTKHNFSWLPFFLWKLSNRSLKLSLSKQLSTSNLGRKSTSLAKRSSTTVFSFLVFLSSFPCKKCLCKTILGFEEDLRAWTYDLHHVVSGFWGWTFGKCPTARRYFASLDGTWQQVIQIWRLLRSCKTHLTIISWVGWHRFCNVVGGS